MDYRILKLLGLQGLTLITMVEHFPNVFLYVLPRRKTADCPVCNHRSKYIHEYRPPQVVKHHRLGRKQSYLILSKRRFYCQFCHKPFTEEVIGVDKWQRKTQGLNEDIIELLKESSFLGVKRRLGVNYAAQIKVLRQTMKPFVGNWQREVDYQGNISIGFDGHSFSGHDMVLTITNLTFPRLVSILPDDRQATLKQFLANIPNAVVKKINSCCIDMDTAYLAGIKTYLSHAAIVIDKFHVIQNANKRIDEERRILQNVFGWKIPRKIFLKNKEHLKPYEEKVIKSWFKKLADLEFYWHSKETIRDIYQLKNKKEAQQKLNTLIKQMWDQKDRGLTQWANMLYRWQEEILNYWEYRITNAYTEGIHTKCKLIKRLGFGFKNKEVYIRKVALACLPPLMFLPHF